MERLTDRRLLESAVLGGAVLGGGGGGSVNEGLRLGALALERGGPLLASPEELDGRTMVVTVSCVGSPSAPRRRVAPEQYISAIRRLTAAFGLEVGGLISNEMGGAATVNGWLQSAALGLPIVDAPCNGRAHPTGAMGSMGLDGDPNYVSLQAAVGGWPEVAVTVAAPLPEASWVVRQAAVAAGGLVAVARNPVPLEYALQNGAPGAVRQSIALGELLLSPAPPGMRVERAAELLGGEILARGAVEEKELESRGGFDVGRLRVTGWELTVWNEYMTVERDGDRRATFPDLIATLDAETAWPMTSAEVTPGHEVYLLTAPRERLILGAGMRRAGLLREIEEAVGKPILPYVFA